ncbi:HXXEE domain-containing protein [Longimicrobium sp.]|uniref:HXXEE domain-containing protein n=1 Tax=Longimicrobium sp. TaxID=2029185 RepID=UPI002E31928F|nr:HXXEE domain-containing protein [Longimicrobium sp.]HEX6036497.1 HXXEE domain-containing protein [Longimicrobium sp.]
MNRTPLADARPSRGRIAGTAADARTPIRRPPRALLLAVPALLTLHNAEEWLAMPRALPMAAERMPDAARAVLPAVTLPMFGAALAVATGVPWIIARMAIRGGHTATYLLLVVQATVLVNVASHLASAAVLRGYAPGLATALALNLPFGILLLRTARRDAWTGRRAWRMLLPLALVAHGPVLVALLWTCGRITGAF